MGILNRLAESLRNPGQGVKCRVPEEGSVRFDRRGSAWTFLRAQKFRPYDGRPQDQLIYENAILGARAFTPGFKDFEGERVYDLIHAEHPGRQALGQVLNLDLIAAIVSITRADAGTPITWAEARARADSILRMI